MIRVLTPEEAAQAIIGGIKRDKQEVVAPFMLRFVFALNYLFPDTTRRMMSAGGNHGKTATEAGGKT